MRKSAQRRPGRLAFGFSWSLALAMLFGACADDKQPEADLATTNGDADDAGDVTAAASNAQGGDTNEGNSEQSDDAAPKQAIAEDGYDDDWNDIGSQQQQQKQQQVANKKQEEQPALEQEEPQLAEEQPAQQAPAQIPVQEALPEEPPVDAEPAPVAESPAAPAAPAAPALPALVSGAPLLRSDVEPMAATLYWVGYDFAERDSLVRIEMVTRGSPKFNLFQERNQADQPELVVRFFNTRLRDKVRRDINASEFRSPVAFVRMRQDDVEMTVDVVMTLRDAVQPRMYTKNGNVMLTFPIPDHYFGNSTIGSAPVAKAEVLANANVMPEIDPGSDIPEGMKIARAFINNPAEGAFPGAPADGGTPVVAPEAPLEASGDPTALPADFGNETGVADQGVIAPNANGLDVSNQQALPDQGDQFDLNGEEADDQLDAQQFDNAEFDGEPTPNQQEAAPNFDEGSEQSLDEEEQLDEDSLEDFDDGEGESNSDIDKFDVRARRLGPAALAGFRVAAFSLAGVAQDDLQENLQENQQAQGNDALEDEQSPADEQAEIENQAAQDENYGNGNLEEQNAQQGQGDFQGANGNQSQNGNLLGEGGEGNAPVANAPAADSFPGFDQSAPQDTLEDPAPVPVQTAPVEPPLEGQPDLAGPETEGTESGAEQPASAGGRPVKLDFRNAPLKDVIRVLSEETGVNFVIPNQVGEQRVFINLTGVPFNDALKALLETNQLGMVEVGPNLIRIDSLARIAQDRQNQEALRRAERLLLPQKVLVHRLSYARAPAAATMLASLIGGGGGGQADAPRFTVQTDERTNSIIVRAGASELATVKALLERIDQETPQVKIASRIVEVFKKFTSRFGISWGGPLNFDAGRGLGFGTLPFPNQMVSRYAVDAGGMGGGAGQFQAHIGSISDSVSLDLALAMEETRGTTEILQSSNVLVEDNQEAVITAGTTDFFRGVAVAGVVAPATELEYNLQLTVTPRVTGDGSVGMVLNIVNRAALPSAAGADASRSTRELRTTLLRRSGETAVIGGVYTNSRTKTNLGVPGLSSIPIIGALFRNSAETDEKRELLVMVTPTIMSSSKTGDQAQLSDVALNTTQSLSGNLQENQGEDNLDLNSGGQQQANFQQQQQQQQQQQANFQQQQQQEPQQQDVN